MSDTLTVHADMEAMSRAVARQLARLADAAAVQFGSFGLVLAGGSTPRRLYELLATEFAAAIPWDRVRVYFGDERCVPADHPDSNYRSAKETLLSRVPVAMGQVARIRGEDGPAKAADRYDTLIRHALMITKGRPFDVVLLGMGADGHTASLFPGRDWAADEGLYAAPATAPPGFAVAGRVTMTLAAFALSPLAIVMVSGADKRATLAEVRRQRAIAAPDLPASRIPAAQVQWHADRFAAEP